MLLEVSRIRRQFPHRRRQRFIRDGHETGRTAFEAVRIAVDFDEAVGEIHGRIVLDPIGVEAQPVLRIAGLVVANQVANHLRLRGIGQRLGPLQVLIRLAQVQRVNTGRNLSVRGPGAIHLFVQLPVGVLHDARVQRILGLKTLQVRFRQSWIERVGARLYDVLAGGRTLGRGHRLKGRIEERRAQRFELLRQHLRRR